VALADEPAVHPLHHTFLDRLSGLRIDAPTHLLDRYRYGCSVDSERAHRCADHLGAGHTPLADCHGVRLGVRRHREQTAGRETEKALMELPWFAVVEGAVGGDEGPRHCLDRGGVVSSL